MIRRRHVFYVSGYDPQGVDGYHRLFCRELKRFQQLWPVKAAAGEPRIDADGLAARWQIETQGPNWHVSTTYEFLRWDDLVARDLRRPFFGIVLRVLYCLGENLLNGTLLRTFRAGWRFGLFYLVSIFAMTATVASALLLAWLTYLCAGTLLAAGAPLSLGAAIVAGVFLLAVARWLCRRWLITRICAMWPWYRELAHRRQPDLHTRIGEFARRIVVKARAAEADEILVVGHSAGGTILIPLLARALELDADFAGAGSPVTALALGSNLPLAALHPNGDDFRNAIRRVAVEPSLTWIDCQARKDVVNFQDCDMVAGLGVRDGTGATQSIVLERALSRDRLCSVLSPAPLELLSHALSIHHGQRPARILRLSYVCVRSGPSARVGARRRADIGALFERCELCFRAFRSGPQNHCGRLCRNGSRSVLEQFPEKWPPVFRENATKSIKLERFPIQV